MSKENFLLPTVSASHLHESHLGAPKFTFSLFFSFSFLDTDDTIESDENFIS